MDAKEAIKKYRERLDRFKEVRAENVDRYTDQENDHIDALIQLTAEACRDLISLEGYTEQKCIEQKEIDKGKVQTAWDGNSLEWTLKAIDEAKLATDK